ncbi:MAG TPA: ATP-binding protein [Conexibacter sp.]|jgi:AAA+ ATPase superfamily predicted ATPase|nr:ATP-binding protein [Conexibacter sp.]
MPELIDRKCEQRLLRNAVSGPGAALIVMIGRRRVGKSFLLAHTFTKQRTVSFQGDEQSERQHLELLAEEAGRTLLGSPSLAFATWDDALTFLGEQAQRKPLTVILDEFQWLKAAQPALDSIVQRHWDRWDRDDVPITLVLSGSALTLMERMLERGAPLFGRATARPRIDPLDYRDATAFASTADPVALLRRWAVLGGTPQYQLWAGPGELRRLIATRILTKDAPLYDEPRHLLREGEGIRDPGTYLAILRAIAAGATTHNAIARRAGVQTGNLARKLERLEDLGYVTTRHALGVGGPEGRASNQIADPFFRFWFRYLAGNRSRLESGRVDDVLDEIVADLDNVMGWAFEQCCRRWAATYADEAALGRPREIGSWWSRDGSLEVDVVGVRDHRYVLVGSCKWRRTADIDVLADLRRQQDALGPKAARARLALFARERFTDRLRLAAKEDDVLLVTAADLFGS